VELNSNFLLNVWNGVNLDKITLRITTTPKLSILALEFSQRKCIGTQYWIGKLVCKHTFKQLDSSILDEKNRFGMGDPLLKLAS